MEGPLRFVGDVVCSSALSVVAVVSVSATVSSVLMLNCGKVGEKSLSERMSVLIACVKNV